MKKTLEPLIAVCVFASVAQAQLCHTEPTSDGVRATLVFTSTEPADAVSELAAVDGLTGKDASVSLVPDIGHPWFKSGFNEQSPDESFVPNRVASSRATRPLGSSDDRFESAPTNTFTFTPSTPSETAGIAVWLVESGTDMRLQGMLEALEPDVQSVIEQQESDAGAATATESKSVPEPTTYGLFGVMALLGLAIARKSSGS